MPKITQDMSREIIVDFADAISERKQTGSAPRKTVIHFREDKANNFERTIYEVPLELLRYRKDNGRIVSEVLSYERTHSKALSETSQQAQSILKDFLYNEDPDNTEILYKSIKKDGQSEPAIITCDGFLINGNRRKVVIERLHQEDPSKYKTMKVVILPGEGDEGGPPTIKEIDLLENRYQLQQHGKSEYSGINKAISIRQKEKRGIPVEEQLIDDPRCAGLSVESKEFKSILEKQRKEYLLPLDKCNEYLVNLGRDEHYDSIKDRWQAFIDYSHFFYSKLKNEKWQISNGISEEDIGDIQDIAFKIIRKQNIKGKSVKLHQIMRDFSKLLPNNDSRESLSNLNKYIVDLSESEKVDEKGNELSLDRQDLAWGVKNETIFSKSIVDAYSYFDAEKENEGPHSLMRAAYKKLIHTNMVVKNIPDEESKLRDFIKEAEKVIEKADELKSEAWKRCKK